MGEGKEKLFVVSGLVGEFSDRREWMVCAFRSMRTAQEYVNLLTALRDLLRVKCGENLDYWHEISNLRETEILVALDAQLKGMDMTGYLGIANVVWSVGEVEVRA